MKKPKNTSKNIYTDLALEAHELAREVYESDEVDGVKIYVENFNDDIKMTSVKILNEDGQEKMGKPVGNYITIESEYLQINDTQINEKVVQIMSEKLNEIYKFKKDDNILIIGLGNWNITPDALGPKVVNKVLVTRHIKDSLSDEIKNDVIKVSAMSPGVMGLTGLDTMEIVKGIVDNIKPTLVIAVDALASRKTSRVNTTIQISDTGISPGAGMGKKRITLDKESLGVDVIGIGVPTVVDAATLVNDSLDLILESMKEEIDIGENFYNDLLSLDSDYKYGIIKKVLTPYVGNMFVTPKEVDEVVERISQIIANAITIAIHPSINMDDINRYIL